MYLNVEREMIYCRKQQPLLLRDKRIYVSFRRGTILEGEQGVFSQKTIFFLNYDLQIFQEEIVFLYTFFENFRAQRIVKKERPDNKTIGYICRISRLFPCMCDQIAVERIHPIDFRRNLLYRSKFFISLFGPGTSRSLFFSLRSTMYIRNPNPKYENGF